MFVLRVKTHEDGKVENKSEEIKWSSGDGAGRTERRGRSSISERDPSSSESEEKQGKTGKLSVT